MFVGKKEVLALGALTPLEIPKDIFFGKFGRGGKQVSEMDDKLVAALLNFLQKI